MDRHGPISMLELRLPEEHEKYRRGVELLARVRAFGYGERAYLAVANEFGRLMTDGNIESLKKPRIRLICAARGVYQCHGRKNSGKRLCGYGASMETAYRSWQEARDPLDFYNVAPDRVWYDHG